MRINVHRILFMALAMAALFCESAWSQTHEGDKILFLHLVKKGNQITLREVTIVDGKLKKRRDFSGKDITYEISNAAGAVITEGALPAPDVLYYDQEPADRDRGMEGGAVILDSVTFVLRLPYSAEYAHAAFFLPHAPAGGDGVKRSTRVLLGSFDLPLTGGRK